MLRYLAHELDSQDYAFRLHSGNKKHNMDFQYPQDLCFLEKYDGGSDSVAFVQNSGILKTRVDKMGDHMKINFDYIQIQRCMSRTVRAKKLDGKSGQIVQFSCFLSKLWSLYCQKLALYIRSFRKQNVLYVLSKD